MESDRSIARERSGPASGRLKRVPDPSSRLDVGPVSALAIENSGFGTADVVESRVSYVMLRDAGVSPLDADRLRRRHSLVWTFRWTEGAYLVQRAERLRTLRETERDWIAASVSDDRRARHRARRRWAAVRRTTDTFDEDVDAADDARDDATDAAPTCPRCGAASETYALDDRTTVTCGDCGHARIGVDHRTEPSDDDSWTAAVRRFLADR
jgi:ribosomal protein S27AE